MCVRQIGSQHYKDFHVVMDRLTPVSMVPMTCAHFVSSRSTLFLFSSISRFAPKSDDADKYSYSYTCKNAPCPTNDKTSAAVSLSHTHTLYVCIMLSKDFPFSFYSNKVIECYTTFPSISPLHTHIHIICLLPFSSQACQYVKSQIAGYPLGKVDTDTTWEVSDPSDETFTFVITYKNGQKTSEGRDRYN